jgi:hypothetical protein
LNEVVEERGEAHEIANGLQDWPPCRHADMRKAARLEEITVANIGAGRKQAETGEAFEDDSRKKIKVSNEECEKADIERLLDEPKDDSFTAKRPEQSCECHVEDDERRGEKRNLGLQQAEAAVDERRKDPSKLGTGGSPSLLL